MALLKKTATKATKKVDVEEVAGEKSPVAQVVKPVLVETKSKFTGKKVEGYNVLSVEDLGDGTVLARCSEASFRLPRAAYEAL